MTSIYKGKYINTLNNQKILYNNKKNKKNIKH